MTEVAPKNQTEERFEPDHVHLLTFGSPPRNSVPIDLAEPGETNSMLSAGGRFASLKRTIEMTNAEIYRYLRLGVSTQSASYLKWMGYETPESLQESPKTAALLPDHLARGAAGLPVRFIDACEAEGVSAVVCQIAIRRGITERHLDGPLSLSQLLYAFTNIVKKNVTLTTADFQPSLINYVCDGTIPFDLIRGGDISSPGALKVALEILVPDPESEIAVKLRNDPESFQNFANLAGSYNRIGVHEIKKCIEKYGYDVLKLVNPALCSVRVFGKKTLGYDVAMYIQQFISESHSWNSVDQLQYVTDRVKATPRGGGWSDTVEVTYEELYKLHKAGIDPIEAYTRVIDDKLPASSLLIASEDGVATSLMAGAL